MSFTSFKRFIGSFIPEVTMNRLRAVRVRVDERSHSGETLEQTFSRIYSRKAWGESESGFFSGQGSHDEAIVAPYLAAVRNFVAELETSPSVVDLGCGDFNVGRQLRDVFSSYIACDIVPELIADNQKRYGQLKVDFRVLNVAADVLPYGDVVLVRQVLQHLSNRDILATLPKLKAYRYAIITEHLPANPNFRPNIDKASGAHVRTYFGSGIVLTEPPFSLKPLSERILCEVLESSGSIRTTAYKLH